jgi:hypothetical protein
MDSAIESSTDAGSTSTALPASDSGKETSQSEDSSVPSTGNISTPQDYKWVTGNSDSLIYVGRIGVGSSSGVHEVKLRFIHADT